MLYDTPRAGHGSAMGLPCQNGNALSSFYRTILCFEKYYEVIYSLFAQIAQLVEQRTENPCVGGSILPLGTILYNQEKC